MLVLLVVEMQLFPSSSSSLVEGETSNFLGRGIGTSVVEKLTKVIREVCVSSVWNGARLFGQ